ncbi:MAG TPA: hypothetical protein PLQ39_12745, partial [Acinetobacter sp.]|nr:hypothetical protein [Acinetobacter sp.]
NRKTEMETNLKNLQHFVEGSVDRLLRLNLITQNDFSTITGIHQEQDSVIGHSFIDQFKSNYIDAILYIQAYLHNKGVFYQKDLCTRQFF